MRNIVYIKNAQVLTMKSGRLKIRNPISNEAHFMYCDEISVLVLENKSAFVRIDAINELLRHSVTILICDERFVPRALISNEFGYHLKLKVLKLQIGFSKKAKDRLWQKVIKSKIENQLQVIRWNVDVSKITERSLAAFAGEVLEGDKTCREAVVSRAYFPLCYGKEFRRGRYNDKINASLNYGYAVLRAIIRKSLVTNGFEPCLGFHHNSMENPFNLSDDVIEAYRPFVDMIVLQYIVPSEPKEFVDELRLLLLEKLLTLNCIICDKGFTLFDAIELTVESLKNCYEKNSSSGLLLPKLIEP